LSERCLDYHTPYMYTDSHVVLSPSLYPKGQAVLAERAERVCHLASQGKECPAAALEKVPQAADSVRVKEACPVVRYSTSIRDSTRQSLLLFTQHSGFGGAPSLMI
jgi:hypothetical protein